MIRTTKTNKPGLGIKFKEHKLAHDLLDGLTGIELGSASHNSFNLAGSINVGPASDPADYEHYKQSQIEMCGAYDEIDVDAEAHALPFEDSSQDYIISSHVFEHLPDPIAAIREWNRVVRDGGYVFMIVPQPGALPEDKGRPLANLGVWIDNEGLTVDTWDYEANPVPGGRRGHYYVYSLDTLIGIFDGLNEMGEIRWSLVADEAVDTKVGNGFTLVYRVNKPELEVDFSEDTVEVEFEPMATEQGPAFNVEQPKPRRSRKKALAVES